MLAHRRLLHRDRLGQLGADAWQPVLHEQVLDRVVPQNVGVVLQLDTDDLHDDLVGIQLGLDDRLADLLVGHHNVVVLRPQVGTGRCRHTGIAALRLLALLRRLLLLHLVGAALGAGSDLAAAGRRGLLWGAVVHRF